MKHNRVFLVFIAGIFFAISSMTGTGCANAIAPTGGPRDSIPPLLISATPKDSLLNFTNNKITFVFNEYVEVQEAQQNVIVSPYPKIPPTIEFKLRTVMVKIKDTLEPGTTYSINFGNSIRDINEGNIAKNLTYIFSTGDSISNYSLAGKVLVAETGQVDSSMIVVLHRNLEDSAIYKERPRYMARVDGTGNFVFRNLPSGQFRLYAMKDESNQRRYLSKSQLFAFSEKPVIIGETNPPQLLYSYVEKEENPASITTALTPAQRTAAREAEKKAAEDKRLKYRTSLENNLQDILKDLVFDFTTPLKNFDSTKFRFLDEKFAPLTGYSFIRDTTETKITLVYPWKENTAYNIILDKDFAEDSIGRKIPRTDTLDFKTLKNTDYGSVHIRFNNIDLSRNPVLQLFVGTELRFSSKLTSRDFTRKLFKPGDFEIRILYDDNGNGVWDAGEFFGKRRQPEKVQPITRKLLVKANWDNDLTIEL